MNIHTAAAAAAAAALVVLAGCSASSTEDADDGPGRGARTASTAPAGPGVESTTSAPTTSTTEPSEPDDHDHHGEDGHVEDAPAEGAGIIWRDFSGVEFTDPESVAAAFGCAYMAHPWGEHPTEMAQRLEPLLSDAAFERIDSMNYSDYGQEVRSAFTRIRPHATLDGWYRVWCTLDHLDEQGQWTDQRISFPSMLVGTHGPYPDGTYRVDNWDFSPEG